MSPSSNVRQTYKTLHTHTHTKIFLISWEPSKSYQDNQNLKGQIPKESTEVPQHSLPATTSPQTLLICELRTQRKQQHRRPLLGDDQPTRAVTTEKETITGFQGPPNWRHPSIYSGLPTGNPGGQHLLS